jgi:hypothetical protein
VGRPAGALHAVVTRALAPALVRALVPTLALGLALAGAGCSQDCCAYDSFPITLDTAPPGAVGAANAGGLLTLAQVDSLNSGQPFPMSVDTAAELTLFDGSADGTPDTMDRSLEILDVAPPSAVRARFIGISTLRTPIGSVGDQATHPLGVLGGDLLSAFSIELHFGVPSLTFWPYQTADDGALENAGYAVVHFNPFGGGQLTAQGDPDIFGLRGPLVVPPTRIVFRACAAPAAFDPTTAPILSCCTRADAFSPASGLTGVDLSLLLATGVGPLVLSQSAWTRILPSLPAPPVIVQAPLFIATAPPATGTPVMQSWTTIPRLALVNQESDAADDAGPCVDLARARRLEQVSFAQANCAAGTCTANPTSACVQPCDTDPQETDKAQNSAAYLELGGDLPVVIVPDDDPMLQGLRADIRPEGPEIDGLIGAGALGPTRVELDYRSSSMRAIFSCDGTPTSNSCAGTPDRQVCWTAARCPRLPDGDSCHSCFNLPPHTLPKVCAASGCP